MEIIRVRILPSGTEAKECNPLGEKPEWTEKAVPSLIKTFYEHNKKVKAWQEAEGCLRTFRIENEPAMHEVSKGMKLYSTRVFEIASTHQAVVVNDKQVRIV